LQSGLNYARQLAVEFLQKAFQSVTLPAQAGIAHAPVLGKVFWELQDIQISDLLLPDSAITIVPGRGVNIAMYATHHTPPQQH
jgi:hypothetical protein